MFKHNNDKKYMFIDANSIRRCKYDVKKEFKSNDYDNVYYQTGYERLDEIFEGKNFPPEFRKLILVYSKKLFYDIAFDYDVYELFTRELFKVSDKRDNPKKKGYSYSNDLTRYMTFETESEFVDYDEVLNFLNELDVQGLYNDYMNSIFDFFRVKAKVLERKK